MGYLNTLLKDIFRGTSEDDGTGDGARDAGKIINDNFDQVDNALLEIDTNAEKKTNRVTNLDLPSDTQYPTSKAVSDALSGLQTGWESYTDGQLTQYQPTSEKGQANGYAPLDATGLVPTSNLPAYVEEIVEGTYINSTTFNDGGGSPITPATNKIYVDTATSKVYRWGGSTFAEIVASPGTTDEVPEGTNNKYFTADRVRAVLLTGYEVVVGFTVSVTDNIVTAIGKLQGQINLINISLAGKLVKGGYTGTAQDLKDLIDTKQTALQVQTLIDQAESTALDKRMANLADDLDTSEQDAIKAKLNVTGGGSGSGVTIETRTGSQAIKPSDQGKRLRANDTGIQTYFLPETNGFTLGQNIEIKQTGLGAVKFDVGPGVTLELPSGEVKEIFSQYDYVNVSPEALNTWGIAGKTKADGFETPVPSALAVSQVTVNSLYWPRVYKSSDPNWVSRVTTTKDYFVLYSSDHEDPDGGVYWGEFDSFDGNILVGFVERGLIVNEFQAETPELNMFPTAVTGLSDELFVSYHTSQDDPSNVTGVQETHVISLANGALHTAAQTDRGKPMGFVGGENHTGYQRVNRKDNGDYVSRFLAVSGTPGTFKYTVSSDPLDFTARTGIIDGTTGMPSGGSYIRGQIHPFEYNSIKYAVIGYIAPSTDRYFAIATIDENFIPNGFVKTIYKADNLRNLELFEDGDDLIILWKKGTDNTDTGYDFTMEKFKKSDLL